MADKSSTEKSSKAMLKELQGLSQEERLLKLAQIYQQQPKLIDELWQEVGQLNQP